MSGGEDACLDAQVRSYPPLRGGLGEVVSKSPARGAFIAKAARLNSAGPWNMANPQPLREPLAGGILAPPAYGRDGD